MSQSQKVPVVHRIPGKRLPPTTVPDKNRPLRDPGPNPGGMPPKGIQPGWTPLRGSGAVYHTHC